MMPGPLHGTAPCELSKIRFASAYASGMSVFARTKVSLVMTTIRS